MFQFSTVRSRSKVNPDDRAGAPLYRRVSSADGIAVGSINAAGSKGFRGSHGHSAAPAPYWVLPAASNVTMTVTSTNPAHLTISAELINSTGQGYADRSIYSVNFLKTMKVLRILGLMGVISYTVVILFSWVYANLQGYVYFSAGEPVLVIKYIEWILGAIGIFAATDCLYRELNGDLEDNNTL